MSLSKSVVSPVLIGRGEDLAVLKGLAGQAVRGEGQTALVSGEAGLGKSRLVSELLKAARQLGAQVLPGNCFESDRALPYAPLLDLLRNFISSHQANDLSLYFGATARELSKVLPELASVDPGPAPQVALDPEQEKRKLFRALAQFLIEQSKKKAFVVIEDLHWSDDTSLEFLLYFARRIRHEPILLLLTYRNDEIAGSLSHFLAELERERLSIEVTLTPLSAGEVATMLRAIFELERPIRAEFLDVLVPLTEGNPFFIEEVLKSLILSGEVFYADGAWDRKPIAELHIPRTIHDAVLRRTQQVSEAARQVLQIAAVAGQRFDFLLLQELTAFPEDALVKVLKELMTVQLIQEETHERFAFRHALTREAIYSQLMERERRGLHLQIAEALERMAGPVPDEAAASLAVHFIQAEAWQKAMEYSHQAAQNAQALYAPRATVEHLTRALDARQHLGLPPLSEWHRARGSAHGLLGDFGRALADDEAALRAAQEAGDRNQEWRSLLDLGWLWAGRDYSETGRYYQRAYDLAVELNEPRILAHSHNRLGNWSVNAEKPLEGLQHHAEALRLFEAQGDRTGLAETLDLLGMANYIHGDLVQSEACYDRAVSSFRELGDRQSLASSLASKMLNSSHLQSGVAVLATLDPAAALQHGEEALRIAGDIGWRSGEAYAWIILADFFGLHGDYGKAFEAAQTSLALAQEIEHRQWMTYGRFVLGGLHLDVLGLAEARQQLELGLALAREIGSRWWITNVSGYLALTHVYGKEPRRAAAVLEAALDISTEAFFRDGGAVQALTMGQRLCWLALGELAFSQGDPAAALHVYEELLASSANGPAGSTIPRLSLLGAKALIGMKRFDEAQAALPAALQEVRRAGERPWVWRIEGNLAHIHQLLGRADQASEALARARQIIAELAGSIGEAGLRDNFSKAALASIFQGRPPSEREAAKLESGGLTAREREVAAMVAQGSSNREIAVALTLGERTIETHVGNILAKLGFSSRAQIAVWVVERGLSREKEG